MDKLIPYFVNLKSNTNIQEVLHSMVEFREVESILGRETLKAKGDFFRHQIYNARLAFLTNRHLKIHKPGTGKSCLQMSISLELMKETDLYTEFLVVTASALTESIKNQFVCKCTNGKFLEIDEKTGELVISKEFKQKFKIETHHDLHKSIKGKTEEELKKMFRRTKLFIDEMSKYILNDFSSKSLNKEDEVEYKIVGKVAILGTIAKEILEGKTTLDDPRIIDNDSKIIQLWRLAQSVQTLNLTGLTGTPIANRPPEFFLLSNIFLPLDLQYDVKDISKRIFTLTLEDFKRLNGYISYVGKSANVALEKYEGVVVPHKYHFNGLDEGIDSQMKLLFRELYHVQAEAIYKDISVINAKQVSLIPQFFTDLNLEISDLPSSYLNEDDDEIEEIDIGYDIERTNLNDPLTRMKTANLINEIAYREREFFNSGEPGVAFVFSKFTKSVFKEFKSVLEAYGFQVITNKDIKISSTKKSYCNTESGNINILTPNTNKPKAVFLDKDTSIFVREQVLKIFSSEENVIGRCIQILIGSKIFEMGYNIGNDDRFYRLASELSDSSDEQSKDRVLRDDSHENKKRYLAKKLNKPISEITPEVVFSYFCAYSRFFYVDAINKSLPYEVNYEDEENDDINKDFDEETINSNIFHKVNNTVVKVNLQGEDSYRIDSRSVCNIIGFCKQEVFELVRFKGNILFELPLFALSTTESDDPYELIHDIFMKSRDNYFKKHKNTEINEDDFDFTRDMDLFGEEGYFVLYSYCGAIMIKETGPNIFNEINEEQLAMIYCNDNFKKIYHPKYKDKYIIADEDSYMLIVSLSYAIPLKMQFISGSYLQYVTMEEKSFVTAKIMRFVEQISNDCLANLARNTYSNIYDYTSKCNYDKCEYKCYSQIFEPDNEDKDLIVDTNELFWDNKELMYSKDNVKECMGLIYGALIENYKIDIDILYNELIDKFDQRPYYINKALVEILENRTVRLDQGNNIPILDRFGNHCFICNNNKMLFLRRDYNDMTVENQLLPDLNVLTLVKSNQEFIFESTVDNELLFKILDIGFQYYDENEELLEDDNIKDQMYNEYIILKEKLKMYSSKFKLYEDAYARIIYSSYYYDEEDGEPIEEYIERPIDNIIVSANHFYANKINRVKTSKYITKYDDIPVFIHTLPKQEITGTKQNIEKKYINIKTFRIFDFTNNIPQWRDPTNKEFETYIDTIKKSNEKFINENLEIYVIQNGVKSKIPSIYHLTNSKDGYKLKSNDSTRKSPGSKITTTKVEKIIKVINYFSSHLDRDEYEENVINKLNKFKAEIPKLKTVDVRSSFITIMESLLLVQNIDN